MSSAGILANYLLKTRREQKEVGRIKAIEKPFI